jgi:soluble lytic murein transglycosylase
MPKPSESIPIHLPFCGTKKIAMKFAVRLVNASAALLLISVAAFAGGRPEAAPASPAANPKQLAQLARALKQKNPALAYAKLSAFALQKSSGALGLRASLALGYFDYSKGNYALAAKWFARAKGDALLRDYTLFWDAETNRALGHHAEALVELQQLRKDFPDSVITDQALQSLAESALAVNHSDDALAALDAYSATAEIPTLLFLRAEAREQAGQLPAAAADFQTIYLHYAPSSQAPEAGMKWDLLRFKLGDQLPPIAFQQRLARASALYAANRWSEARNEYSQLLPQLTGTERERAELRILECGVNFGAGPDGLAALKVTDPELDAERLYQLAQIYRTQVRETDLVAAVEAAAASAPSSSWAASSLFLAGNYYWVLLDRERAAGYYKRVADNFPSAPDALKAQWRVAWVAVLQRRAEAADLLTEHLRRYPGSQFTPDALYWLGRLAEEASNPAQARSYYGKLAERYPQNYFESLAAVRMKALPEVRKDVGRDAGRNDAKDDPAVLATIPPVSAAAPLGAAIPEAAANRQARADALRSIAFDASAELELRAAFAATGEPRFLLEVAQAANDSGHCGLAIVTVRQMFPQLESRPFADVPREVWLAAYPMPFAPSIKQWSTHAGIDPMLVAGLIRQESAFEPEARSGANAVGLMQLLPKTGRRMAKLAKVGYSQGQLYNPDYNVRLGTIYFASLRKDFGSVESALAAYNAGEDRLAQWTAGQKYRDLAEFVDSIPFTETREYVELVSRNGEIYRKLYGAPDEPRKARTRRKH